MHEIICPHCKKAFKVDEAGYADKKERGTPAPVGSDNRTEDDSQAATERARSEEVEAREQLVTVRETAEAEREKQLALIRANEQAEVDETRVHSETGTIMAVAKAEAEVARVFGASPWDHA